MFPPSVHNGHFVSKQFPSIHGGSITSLAGPMTVLSASWSFSVSFLSACDSSASVV